MIDIVRSDDYNLINSILNDPELYKTIAEDSEVKCGEFETLESDHVYYLLPITPDGVAGVFIVHPDSGASHKIHANILKEYRKKYSKDACEEVVRWVWANTRIEKLNCDIPVIYPNVIDRAKACGFVEEGVRTHSYLKNGAACDVMLLGLKR